MRCFSGWAEGGFCSHCVSRVVVNLVRWHGYGDAYGVDPNDNRDREAEARCVRGWGSQLENACLLMFGKCSGCWELGRGVVEGWRSVGMGWSGV